MLKKLYKFPVLNIVAVLLITAVFGYGLTKLDIESDMSDMLPKKNKVYMDNNKINEIYGGSEAMLVGIKSKSGNILTIKNLQTIDNITKAIEDIEAPKKENKSETPETDLDENFDDIMNDIESDLEDINLEDYNNAPQGDSIEIIDDVQSLTNTDIIEGIEGGLEPISMEDIIPTNQEELKMFREKLLSWDMYEDVLYSQDFSAGAINIIFTNIITEDDKIFVNDEIERIISLQNNSDLEFFLAGTPAVSASIVKTIPKDLIKLIPFVIILLILVLFFSFRNIYGVLLPLITVVISTIWTLGLMGFTGIKLSIIGVIIPVLLIAIGSAYGIHFITHYIEEKNKSKCDTKDENKHIVLSTLKNIVLPIFLTSLTTFFGFLSLITMRITSIRDFGLFIAIGVLFEFILSIFLIPSIIILLKPKKEKIKFDEKHTPILEKILIKLARFLKNKKAFIIIFFAIFIVILINGARLVVVDFDMLKFFKKKSTIVDSTKFVDSNLAGSDSITLNIVGQKDGDLAHPDILKAMDNLSIYLVSKHDEIGKVIGFNDMIKRMNQVMHYPEGEGYEKFLKSSITYEELLILLNTLNKTTENTNPDYQMTLESINAKFNYEGYNYNEIPIDPKKYNITDTDLKNYAAENNIDISDKTEEEKTELKKEILKQLISQYLVLYSGEMDNIIADDQMKPKMAKLMISLKSTESKKLKEIIKDIDEYVKNYFPAGYKIQKGGSIMISNELNNIVVKGQIFSFILAILIIFIIVSISYKSIVAGLISTIPIMTSILINFAIMGYFRLDLNIATALIASLSIGIGVDYTIHFLSFYKSNWKKYKDVDKAIEQTFYTSGKAILYNAVSVGLGFAVLLFSSTRLLGTFGILITIVMASSSFGSLTIIPIILEMFKPKFVEK